MSTRVLCTQSQQSLAEFSILVTVNTNLPVMYSRFKNQAYLST